MKHIHIIGGGVAGLSAACVLAQSGLKVTVVEKNDQVGGRARMFKVGGFTFDMGPSWYWMPDVFERFYNLFGCGTSDFYELLRLDPSYQVIFPDGESCLLPASKEGIEEVFERYEPGSSKKLRNFLSSAGDRYRIGMGEFVHKPSLSIFEFFDLRLLSQALRLHLFQSISSEINSLFKHPKLKKLLEFPVLFLGAKPERTPALYSLMNYADMELGTWYPLGGMHHIVLAMEKIARDLGVEIRLGEEVRHLDCDNRHITRMKTSGGRYETDAVISGADYHHTETALLPEKMRSYSDAYWQRRTMAPSALIFYLGVEGKVEGLQHHNLFFDTDFGRHAAEIYDTPSWPRDPLFYVCCPSKTDDSVAPENHENLFILIPLAAGLPDSEEKREALYKKVMARLKLRLKQDIDKSVVFKRSYCINDFVKDYHSFKGNAYGLANTLYQTAILKPRLKSRQVRNLYYAGQLTVPGPGLPPSLISGEVAARQVIKNIS